jgi:hypothetical protein
VEREPNGTLCERERCRNEAISRLTSIARPRKAGDCFVATRFHAMTDSSPSGFRSHRRFQLLAASAVPRRLALRFRIHRSNICRPDEWQARQDMERLLWQQAERRRVERPSSFGRVACLKRPGRTQKSIDNDLWLRVLRIAKHSAYVQARIKHLSFRERGHVEPARTNVQLVGKILDRDDGLDGIDCAVSCPLRHGKCLGGQIDGSYIVVLVDTVKPRWHLCGRSWGGSAVQAEMKRSRPFVIRMRIRSGSLQCLVASMDMRGVLFRSGSRNMGRICLGI